MIVAETTVCPLVKAACRDFAELQGSDLASLNESAVLLLAFALGWCVFRPTLHVLCYRVKPAAGETGKKELHRNAWCSQAVALVDETLGLKKALLTLLGQLAKFASGSQHRNFGEESCSCGRSIWFCTYSRSCAVEIKVQAAEEGSLEPSMCSAGCVAGEQQQRRQQWSQRHVAPILGLPMRGKSHTARELKRYIEFFHGSRAEIFNVMEYQGRGGDEKFFEDLNRFFDTSNSSCDPYDFDQTGSSQGTGGFAIILSSDTVASTQSMWSAHTKWHRRWMAQKLESELKAEVCFIQISVDDPKGDKYLADLAAFRGMDLKESQELINHYQDHYVPIQMDGSEDGTPFIHMMNYTKKMVVNKMMRSFVGSSVCHFLSNLHPFEHKIFLARHGESEFNVEMRIGGDSGLSPRGEEFARRAAEFAKYVVCGEANDLVCVTVTEKDVVSLHEHLVQLCGCLVTCDDWKGFGDSSGAEVNRYMRLKRLQVGWGTDFEDAPKNMDDLRRRLNGAKVATLVLVDGDTSSAGQVPGRLWTSSLRRTIDTAKFIEHPVLTGPDGKPYFQMRGQQFRNMDEVYAGEYDGLTEDIKQKAPNVIEDRKRDKLGFRYPRGESYYDVIARLESVMSHLERIQQPILIISHQAVLRMMYGWLMHINREAAIETQVPQHMIVKITFDGLGGPPVERRYPLGPMEMADDGQANF